MSGKQRMDIRKVSQEESKEEDGNWRNRLGDVFLCMMDDYGKKEGGK